MSEIKTLEFAQYVEGCRQGLIRHCNENGIHSDNNDSLDTVIAKNNTIIPAEQEDCIVEFRDLDGSLLNRQVVKPHTKATVPTEIPNIDSDHLEFYGWHADGDLNDVWYDTLVLPEYRVKYDESIGYRPTILICRFNEDQLSPTFNFQNVTNAHVNAYIDFGDGSVQQVTGAKITHNYATPGNYVIKLYGDRYTIGTNNSGIFSSYSVYGTCLLKCYTGENCHMTYLDQSQCLTVLSLDPIQENTTGRLGSSITSLRVLNFPDCWKNNSSGTNSLVSVARNLKYVVLSRNFLKLSNTFENAFNLKKLVIYDTVTDVGSYCLRYNCNLEQLILLSETIPHPPNLHFCYNLQKIITKHGNNILPNSVQKIQESTFQYCKKLTHLVIPSTVKELINYCFQGIGVKELNIPDNNYANLGQYIFGTSSVSDVLEYTANLTTLNLYSGFNWSIALQSCVGLDKQCLINIVKNVADNTGKTAKNLGFRITPQGSILKSTYINDAFEEVPFDTPNAVTLLEALQNKNWTVALN